MYGIYFENIKNIVKTEKNIIARYPWKCPFALKRKTGGLGGENKTISTTLFLRLTTVPILPKPLRVYFFASCAFQRAA
jgi:hypothetical protein